jgi:hypothetical protein
MFFLLVNLLYSALLGKKINYASKLLIVGQEKRAGMMIIDALVKTTFFAQRRQDAIYFTHKNN